MTLEMQFELMEFDRGTEFFVRYIPLPDLHERELRELIDVDDGESPFAGDYNVPATALASLTRSFALTVAHAPPSGPWRAYSRKPSNNPRGRGSVLALG